jgi:hypothetical protein
MSIANGSNHGCSIFNVLQGYVSQREKRMQEVCDLVARETIDYREAFEQEDVMPGQIRHNVEFHFAAFA